MARATRIQTLKEPRYVERQRRYTQHPGSPPTHQSGRDGLPRIAAFLNANLK